MLADLKAAWAAGSDDSISLIAAGIAHYALLALVPALGALVLAYGVFADPLTVAGHVRALSQNLPPSAAELVGSQLRTLGEGADEAKGLGLLASLGVALFGARGAARALITGLDIAFGASEDRGFVRGNLVAIGVTFAGVAGLALVAGASGAASGLLGPAGGIASFVILAVAATVAGALLYRFVPNGSPPAWSAIWPGAAFFAFGWMGASAAFAFYAANFGSYNATYGTLGAVVVLITWFYASALVLLLGAELVAVKGCVKHANAP